MKKILSIFALLIVISSSAFAQKSESVAFRHLDLSASVGSTGIGIDASTPLAKWIQVRVGVSYMPSIPISMDFHIGMDDDKDNSKFDKMASYLEDLTGYRVDNTVTMEGHLSYVNAKLLFDFFPFSNKNWHITAGAYFGSSEIGYACNSTEDMNTTVAVSIYNNIYDCCYNYEPILGDISLDPEKADQIVSYGKMGMHLGEYKKSGESYVLYPDERSMVTVKAKTNIFKPYIGFGYSHAINDSKWKIGFDAGVIFWGGAPNFYTNDGTNLTKDVENIDGKVGDIIKAAKAFPILPNVELKFARSIF